jgi:hypothetical protein
MFIFLSVVLVDELLLLLLLLIVSVLLQPIRTTAHRTQKARRKFFDIGVTPPKEFSRKAPEL